MSRPTCDTSATARNSEVPQPGCLGQAESSVTVRIRSVRECNGNVFSLFV